MTEINEIEISELIHSDADYFLYHGTHGKEKGRIYFKSSKLDTANSNIPVKLHHEYEMMKGFDIESIPKVLGIGSHGGRYGLVMRNGHEVETLRTSFKNKISMDKFFELSIELAVTIDAIHRKNVIHKTIKPESILRTKENKTGTVGNSNTFLIDFGQSSKLSNERTEMKSANALDMDLRYISPEQTGRMNRMVDWRTDLYSLGIVLYEILTGQVPFAADDAMGMVHAHIAVKPKPLHEVNSNIPKPLSDLVMKLLKKNAEERYQSGQGLKLELNACYAEWKSKGKIETFQVGTLDISDKFRIPQKLYGREIEAEYLMTRFAESAVGKVQLLLVSGNSGLGKSALINEIQKPMVERRGFVIQGKFDQFNRNIPYSALLQAFNGFSKQLMGESETELTNWRTRIIAGVGTNAQVLLDLIPSLEKVIGKQPTVPELGAQESQNRFNLVMENFIRAICRPEHPLVLFLDDMQWADAATFNLLKVMMNSSSDLSLLVIAAYRTNEVDASHGLPQLVSTLEKSGVSVGKIDVSALSKEDVGRLVSDTVLHNVEATRELTQSIYDKTQGNPFFVSEMLGALHRSGAIWFERDELSWQWSMEKVNSSAITDNVVELMTSKLAVLPEASQNLLKIAACVGATFDLRTLSIVSETIGTEVAEKLWLAVEAGMLTPIGEAYKFVKEENQTTEELSSNLSQVKYQFVHDRVQQAAYGLLALDEKEKMHWRVGNLLLAELSQDEMTEKLFDVVGHLNAGKNLATSEMERERLAQLNCDAGKRALSATAFEAAVQYLQKAEELLPSEEWVVAYSITKEVKTELARALMLSAQHEALEIVIQELLSNLRTALERSEVYTIHLRALVMEGKSQECINVGAVALRELGLRFPTKGSLPLALKEVLHTRWVLRNWNENVSMVKISDDLTHRAILNILLRIGEATFIAQPLLIAAVAGTVVRLSLRKGLTSVSPFGFAFFSVLVVTVLQDIKLGERLVIFAEALIQLRELQNASVKGITIFISNMFLWTFRNPTLIVASTLLENTAFLRSVGELSNMANCSSSMLGSYFEISSVNHCMEISTPWQIRIKHAGLENTSASNWLNSMFQSCLSLANTHNQSLLQSEEKSLWSDTHLNRDELIASASRRKDISSIASIYIGEVITEYMSGKIKIALKTAELIKPNREGVQGLNSELYYVYYATLACTAAARGEAGAEEQKKRSKHLRAAKSHLSWLKKRAEWAPMNFLQKYEILQAELLDANGKQVEAAEWYGYSIANADKNGNLSDAGLTRELFGGSLWRAGKRAEATRILKASCKAYTVWGALAVIRKIENKYPDIFAEQIAARKKLELEKSQTKDNTKTASDTLDIQAVMKASQTISGEIELEKLLTKLMTVAMESSGADKAALALWETDIPYIQAESVVNGDTRILQSLRLDECQTLPTSILLSVGRLQKAIVLGNASKSTEFANDVYVKEKQVQSVLCLPIVNQSKLVGVLYVENSLTTDAFTLDRVQLLTMLSSQAAISIDNAKLYSNVQAVTAEKSRIQTEMDVAQKIQTALLPEKPNLKGYEAFGYMKTADEVGGDYYDTIQSGNRQFAVIGDVSGHGVTSGLVMMMAQTILHTIINANGTESTAEILSRANVTLTKNIVKLKESKYMTMTLLEMKENGHVRYAGAHLDSIVYRHNTNQIDILPSSGFWLGMEDDISAYMVEQKASLNNGDILLLFTDGVTEAIGTDKKLFGSDRLGEVLKDNASLSLETIKDSILKSLASFETPDDVTLLVIRKMDGD